MLKVVLFVLPLGLDTFAVATALGMARPSGRRQLRLGLVMAGFEMAMPLVGLAAGRGLGAAVGSAADWVAVAVLAALGAWMLVHDEEWAGLPGGFGATLALGLSISLDELAIGFSMGLLRLSLWLTVALIGAQAFLVSQLGLALGRRVGAEVQEGAERLAGLALLGLALLLVLEKTL
ncbi:MAG: manganese efflux pump [Actinobacteria bacterium]|nr:manganese efflux pump [Actinomycetota bacterium]